MAKHRAPGTPEMKAIALLTLFCCSVALAPLPARAQQDRATPFLGTWCAQGDPAKRTAISANGFLLTLTNEVGSTSTGHVMGMSPPQIIADQWGFVRGTLSPNGRTISWTNGTYWARCPTRTRIDLQGTWYAGGDQSKPCRISQRGSVLSLRNEIGQTASGSFTSKYDISTVWSGMTITGTISRDQNRIVWSNGTYWTR